MQEVVAICLGIGLAAACGFRVFVPLLAISAAALSGNVQLASGMEWMGTWPALICFLTAMSLEIAAYYVPWLDNALDSIATPAAVVAGTVAASSMITDMSPLLQWTLALIAGGGLAGLIQAATVGLRGASSVTTAGTGNFLVASLELAMSVAITIFSFVLPVITVLLLAVVVGVALRVVLTRRAKDTPPRKMKAAA